MENTEMYKEMFRAFHRFGKTAMEMSLPEISKSEYMLLNAIYKMEREADKNTDKKAHVSYLAKTMCVAPPAISRSLKTLENKGYIARTVDEKDRRNTRVTITKAGNELRDQIERMLKEHMEHITESVGQTDMRELIRLLDNLCVATEKELGIEGRREKEDIQK